MTLEQALVNLSEKDMWLRPYTGETMSWVVWGLTAKAVRVGFRKAGEGDTWQEAYAEAMNEAPQ